MRVISTTQEQTATCPKGTVFAYMPADVARSTVPIAWADGSHKQAAMHALVLSDTREVRTVTCPCCWARVEVTP